MGYIHARVFNNGITYIYEEKDLKLKTFGCQTDAIIYLQKKGFKISAINETELWFVKDCETINKYYVP